MNTLLAFCVYAFIGVMLLTFTLPLWIKALELFLDFFCAGCALYARFEAWRDRRRTTPR